ncbi:hypothetical protein [Ralstonia solanacearum]|uniref:hypothetical protein n=1 Tax=Ralstonia solanacearum TaxID=305 RepID=UPI000E576D34|nr:hypothetical protein [Ralstonia solanacearum]
MVGFWFFLQGVCPLRCGHGACHIEPGGRYQRFITRQRRSGSTGILRGGSRPVACTPVAAQPGNPSQARRLTNDRTSTLKTRTLGNSGLEVSELGFGCMDMRVGYGPTSLSRNEPIAEASEPELACAAAERRGGVDQGVGQQLAGRTWHAAP